MNRQIKNGVTIMTFDSLDREGIKHCFSTRLGGVSKGGYASMNLGFNRGDADENVYSNYVLMAKALGVEKDRMCLSQQTHTTNVRVMTEADAGNGMIRPLPYTDVDGMITDVRGMTLVTFYADCVPLYFYDPENKAIGLSHSGWRGTVGRIGKNTIELMHDTYGSDPDKLICCIGPSICSECYEVSGDVAERFRKEFGEGIIEKYSILKKSTLHPEDSDKYMLDLWNANRVVMLEAGVKEDNIEVTDHCTHCRPDLFYSHRIMGTERGSLAAFLSL